MRLLPFLISVLLFFSCNQETKQKITHKVDYDRFLSTESAKTTSKYFNLWNTKIKPDSTQLMSFGIVAGQYSNYFKATGDIEFLKKAEQALKKAVEIAAIGKAGYYRALARNYISQHRFKEALHLASSSRAKGSGLIASQSLLFDVHMELGNYHKAEKYLDSIKNMSSFGYLIRLAKWNDHKGDIDTTIEFMEKAKSKVEMSRNKDLMLWVYTNLADYYGHAGRIADSYKYYLKSLELDPKNAYAKKGIAWIVFSHEKNPKEALRILDLITENYKAPDYYLFKAEIANYLKDNRQRLSNLDKYYSLVQNPAYGNMYNAHNVVLHLDETRQYDTALQLAKKEVENRATPESYDLLAYSYFKRGKLNKAIRIVEEHIKGKTYEPAVLLHVAEIYKASGMLEEARELKTNLLGAVYELGPNMEQKIINL